MAAAATLPPTETAAESADFSHHNVGPGDCVIATSASGWTPIYYRLMVNPVADSDRLSGRAARLVTTITGASAEPAAQALRTSEGEVKPAILIAAGATSLAHAVELLGATKGNLREALGKPEA